MTLSLKSCVPVRDLRFSSRQCLEVAAKLEAVSRATVTIDCSRADCDGSISISSAHRLTSQDRRVIIAALREYARG